MEKFDITPATNLIEAIQNQDWDAKGCYSEWFDNSLGQGRGNATFVRATWDQRTRTASVLDNGRGMEQVCDLFLLGKTAGRATGDIGKYGVGGTMALAWLGDIARVTTLRDGQVSNTAQIIWRKVQDSGKWSIDYMPFRRATLANTPEELLELGHGTLLEVHVPRHKRFHGDAIVRGLAELYAPAIRMGRRLEWRSINTTGKQTLTALAAPMMSPAAREVREIHIQIQVGETTLAASGVVGIDDSLKTSQSGLAICYGTRAIRTLERDCFESPDESRSYSGVGLTGWVDLGEGWQDFLTTTKRDFHDAEARDALMGAIFAEIEPLLIQLEREGEALVLEDLSLGLSVKLEGALNVDVQAAPRERTPKYHFEKTGDAEIPPITPVRPPEAGTTDSDGTTTRNKTATKIWIEFSNRVAPLYVDIRISSDGREIKVFADKDFPYFQEARRRQMPVQDMLLNGLIIPAVIEAILDQSEEIQRRIIPPGLYRRIEEQENRAQKVGVVSRHILMNLHQAVAA